MKKNLNDIKNVEYVTNYDLNDIKCNFDYFKLKNNYDCESGQAIEISDVTVVFGEHEHEHEDEVRINCFLDVSQKIRKIVFLDTFLKKFKNEIEKFKDIL